MFRKTLTAMLLALTLIAAVGMLPGVVENVAFACDPSDLGCDTGK